MPGTVEGAEVRASPPPPPTCTLPALLTTWVPSVVVGAAPQDVEGRAAGSGAAHVVRGQKQRQQHQRLQQRLLHLLFTPWPTSGAAAPVWTLDEAPLPAPLNTVCPFRIEPDEAAAAAPPPPKPVAPPSGMVRGPGARARSDDGGR